MKQYILCGSVLMLAGAAKIAALTFGKPIVAAAFMAVAVALLTPRLWK